MNAFLQWLAPDVLRALGLTLSHFLWQGAAIAALAAGATAAASKASSRYVIAVAALFVLSGRYRTSWLVQHPIELCGFCNFLVIHRDVIPTQPHRRFGILRSVSVQLHPARPN